MTAALKALVIFLFGASALLIIAAILRALQSKATSGLELFTEPSKATVTLFTMATCPYCQRMKPEWEKFKEMAKSSGIETAEVSPDTGAKIIEEKRINGFPTVLVTVGGKDVQYPSDGDHPRTADGIMAFVQKQIGGR